MVNGNLICAPDLGDYVGVFVAIHIFLWIVLYFVPIILYRVTNATFCYILTYLIMGIASSIFHILWFYLGFWPNYVDYCLWNVITFNTDQITNYSTFDCQMVNCNCNDYNENMTTCYDGILTHSVGQCSYPENYCCHELILDNEIFCYEYGDAMCTITCNETVHMTMTGFFESPLDESTTLIGNITKNCVEDNGCIDDFINMGSSFEYGFYGKDASSFSLDSVNNIPNPFLDGLSILSFVFGGILAITIIVNWILSFMIFCNKRTKEKKEKEKKKEKQEIFEKKIELTNLTINSNLDLVEQGQ